MTVNVFVSARCGGSGNSPGQDSTWLMFRQQQQAPRGRSAQDEVALKAVRLKVTVGFILSYNASPCRALAKNVRNSNKLHKQTSGSQCSVGVTTDSCWIKQTQLWGLALLPRLRYFSIVGNNWIQYRILCRVMFALFQCILGIQDVVFFHIREHRRSKPSMFFFNFASETHMIDHMDLFYSLSSNH